MQLSLCFASLHDGQRDRLLNNSFSSSRFLKKLKIGAREQLEKVPTPRGP
jgi:hypothetical protein